jgi:tape measure domain-containing protein
MADIKLVIKADALQAEKDFQSFAGSTEKVKKAVEDFQKSFDPKKIDEFIAKNKLNALGIQQTQGPLKSVQAETKGYEKEIRKLISSGLSPQSAEIQKLQKEYDQSSQKLAVLTAATKNNTQYVNKQNNAFTQGIKSVLGYAAAYVSLRGVVNVFKSIITEARKLEDAEAAFTPLMGGAAKAKELVNELNITAAKTPYQFQTIQKAVSTLLPVMNSDIKNTIDTFKMLGDTAGGNAQKLESVTRGYTKAMLKGKVDMESLNMIAEAGVPIFNEMASVMGYGKDNMGAFFKEISSGKVQTSILTEAFKKMTSEGGIFFEGMIISSRTTSGVLSTLKDNIALTGATLGQSFLPFLKEVALKIIAMTGGIREWITTGDNLSDTLKIIGYSLAGLTSAFLAYNIATKASAAVIKIMEIAQKGLNTAMKANLIGIIATIVTAVLIPAIILLVKNWDLVKYKVVDFALAAKEMMLKFSLVIKEKVIGAIADLYDKLSELPVVGETFKKMADYQRGYIEETRNAVTAVQNERAANKTAFDAAEVERLARMAGAAEETKAVEDENSKRGKSYTNMIDTMKAALDMIQMSERAKTVSDIAEAQAFFEQRAQLEADDYDGRIAYMQEKNAEIQAMEGITASQRAAMEVGLSKAIEAERKKQMKIRLQNAQQLLSTTGTMISDLQAVLANFGKQSRELAIAGKAVAVAQALINTYLGVTKAWGQGGIYGAAFAAVVLAAGLASVAKIVTTPIPSGQTGLEYTVPDIPSNRNDKAPVRASAGEKVTVTPRGEESGGGKVYNFMMDSDTMFSFIQRGIDTGKLNFSNKNIRGGVFA